MEQYKIKLDQFIDTSIEYRRVVYTDQIQVVIMNLIPGENIPKETHNDTVQMIRVESGKGYIEIDDEHSDMFSGECYFIPPGVMHYVENNGDEILKLFIVYSNEEHDMNLVQKRQ